MISTLVAATRRFGAEAATSSRRRGFDDGLAATRSRLADASTPVACELADFRGSSARASGCGSGPGSGAPSIVVSATGLWGAS
ncbi:hypothetical protein QTI33_23745 [Variovorax sp. J22P271]|uniref:hypothetical protein n=1 Tax=Variovorax davisae TaxID=3053515 RepID=UPI0025776233|nr:hypothetical protein [Variovorax sp. J22P271]MDM0035169.1 hypothetical protein [Variovorax sp. J22P271]